MEFFFNNHVQVSSLDFPTLGEVGYARRRVRSPLANLVKESQRPLTLKSCNATKLDYFLIKMGEFNFEPLPCLWMSCPPLSLRSMKVILMANEEWLPLLWRKPKIVFLGRIWSRESSTEHYLWAMWLSLRAKTDRPVPAVVNSPLRVNIIRRYFLASRDMFHEPILQIFFHWE